MYESDSSAFSPTKIYRSKPPLPRLHPTDVLGHSQLLVCPNAIDVVKGDGEVYRSVCGVASCSQECHKRWARKLAVAFERSWLDPSCRPSTTFRLSVAPGLSEKSHIHAEQKFFRRLSRRGVQYACVREWEKPGKPFHTHGASRCGKEEVSVDSLDCFWHDCLPDGFHRPVYAAPIENLLGLARYLPKAVNQHYCLPPRWFPGKVYFRSRGALIAPVADLWRQQIKQWYPD